MNDETRRISEMATRMDGFGGLTVDDFPANSPARQRFNELHDLCVKIDTQGAKEALEKNAAKAATKRKAARVESARRQMKNIRETILSVEGQQPGISQNFNMPSSNSAEALIEGARAYIAAATPLKPLFLSREMPEDFLENLAETIRSYDEVVDDYNTHNVNRKGAKVMLKDACAQVLVIRRELDPIVRNKFRNDPEKLSAWETASHLERPPRRRAAAEPGDGSQPPTSGEN
jgi:hypothetical protein